MASAYTSREHAYDFSKTSRTGSMMSIDRGWLSNMLVTDHKHRRKYTLAQYADTLYPNPFTADNKTRERLQVAAYQVFDNDEYFKRKLMNTGDAVLLYDDNSVFWGRSYASRIWTGFNEMGEILMRIRDDLPTTALAVPALLPLQSISFSPSNLADFVARDVRASTSMSEVQRGLSLNVTSSASDDTIGDLRTRDVSDSPPSYRTNADSSQGSQGTTDAGDVFSDNTTPVRVANATTGTIRFGAVYNDLSPAPSWLRERSASYTPPTPEGVWHGVYGARARHHTVGGCSNGNVLKNTRAIEAAQADEAQSDFSPQRRRKCSETTYSPKLNFKTQQRSAGYYFEMPDSPSPSRRLEDLAGMIMQFPACSPSPLNALTSSGRARAKTYDGMGPSAALPYANRPAFTGEDLSYTADVFDDRQSRDEDGIEYDDAPESKILGCSNNWARFSRTHTDSIALLRERRAKLEASEDE